ELRDCGVKRINVSVDTLDPQKFTAITRWGKLDKVQEGLTAAKDAGLAIKINTVALKGVNEDEIDDLIAWCGREGFDLTLIPVIPMGDIGGEMRLDHDMALSVVGAPLAPTWDLDQIDYRAGGAGADAQGAEDRG